METDIKRSNTKTQQISTMSINLVSDFGYSIMANDQDRKAAINMAMNNIGIQIVKTHLETMMTNLPTIFKSRNIVTSGVIDTVTEIIKCDIESMQMALLQNASAYSFNNDAFDNGPVLPKIIELDTEGEGDEVIVWKPKHKM